TLSLFRFSRIWRAPRPTLFPYTTLFRSGGGKTAYVDEIRWHPVPEVATRVAQVETGELDFADDLNLDAYDRLKKNPNLKAIVARSEEHTSELQSPDHLVCSLLLDKKNTY